MSKHVLRALGLSLLAALGLMAFAATGAQAEILPIGKHVHGSWLVLGLSTLPATVTGEAEGEGRLLVPSLGIEVTCKKFTVIEASISNAVTAGHGIATVLFEECKVYPIEKVLPFKLTSETALPCLPLDSVTGTDGHIRAEALVLVLLHKQLKTEKTPEIERDYIVFEQVNLEAAKPLATIKYSKETGCPIPLTQTVSGQVAFEVITGDKHNKGLEVVEPLITAGNHKTLQELFGLKLLYGVNEGFIDGSAKLKLTGVHKGCIWGVL